MHRFVALVVLAVASALAGSCGSLECGAGTHEEGGACVLDSDSLECGAGTHEEAGQCVANVVECICGPGTIQVPNDLGCECVVAPRLPGARVCGCAIRPMNVCGISDPLPCDVDPDNLNLVFATASDGAGGRLLVGGYGAEVVESGGIAEVVGLQHPFTLDGQPARVRLGVETDGSFASQPGAQLFEWAFDMGPSQPALGLRDIVITGSLDAEGRLNKGWNNGRIRGCFTRANAEAIYLEVLSQTLAQLIDGGGVEADCNATGSGTPDGYTFEMAWYAGEAVEVTD